MTLGELLEAVPPATYVFITVEYASAARAEGTIYGPREDLKIPQDLEATPVTCLYPDRFGNRTAGGLAIFVREA